MTRAPEAVRDGATRERGAAWGRRAVALIVVVALLDVLVGWVHPTVVHAVPPRATPRSELVSLVRVVLAVAAAAATVFGPGLALRARARRGRHVPLGYVPLPGIALLAACGGVVWATSGSLDPQVTSRVLLAVVLAAVLIALWAPRQELLDPYERQVAGLAAAVFTVSLGRSLWPKGPTGELYGGSISRTLEVGDRSDSRISYHVTSLVAHHLNPSTGAGQALFLPYSFSDRGPLAGLAAAPVMLASGTMPTSTVPDQPWTPFDAQGFMAYRIVMMMLAVCALGAVYTVARALAGPATAVFTAAVVSGTPFFVHDVYFTWPKWAAAALCLLAAHQVLLRRPVVAGVLLGLGYLFHPLALLSIPALGLLVLLVALRDGRARPDVSRAVLGLVGLGAGLAVVAAIWRASVRGDPGRGHFLSYLTQAGSRPSTVHNWLVDRAISVANTLVPLRVPIAEARNPAVNAYDMHSGTVIHFFFQYWTGLPFGAGIVFYVPLLAGLWVLARTRPWPFVALVVVPFVVFAVYWGDFDTGLLREGLHAWVLTVLLLWSVTAAAWLHRPRLRVVLRAVLLLRLVEVGLMLVLPTLLAEPAAPGSLVPGVTSDVQLHDPVTGTAAVALMVLGLLGLGWYTLSATSRRAVARPRADAPRSVTTLMESY